jgi:hypothetical protein
MFRQDPSLLRLALAVAALLAACPGPAAAQEKRARPPNILFILADDKD